MRLALQFVAAPVLFGLLSVVAQTVYGGAARGGSSLEYSVSALENYEKGRAALADEEWIEAAKFFTFVKARFPYSKYAAVAELGLADVSFESGAHLEAIDAYQQFIKLHPTHERTSDGYAAFRVGAAYHKMIPEDFFLLPPSHEKDQAAALDALRELTAFLTTHPRSPHRGRAEALHREAGHRLAAHEWYVAEFYWKRGKAMATVLRLRTLLDRYPRAGYDEEARWLLGRAYLAVDRPADAKKQFHELIEKHAAHPRAAAARRALQSLGATPAAPPATLPVVAPPAPAGTRG